MKNVYAPSILKTADGYRMWYTDVGVDRWVIPHAHSTDGKSWRMSPRPCLQVDQKWERQRLFYPAVLRIDGVYLMWYGSYWTARRQTTAIGFAVSADGLTVLSEPSVPLHNNASELGARVSARRRDVSLHSRSERGVRAMDIFTTIVQTSKKLGLSAFAYLRDRMSGSLQPFSLAQAIQQAAASG